MASSMRMSMSSASAISGIPLSLDRSPQTLGAVAVGLDESDERRRELQMASEGGFDETHVVGARQGDEERDRPFLDRADGTLAHGSLPAEAVVVLGPVPAGEIAGEGVDLGHPGLLIGVGSSGDDGRAD